MPTQKALALVVRGTDWSETSRIATLWTRELGKVRALAKGGRRLRSSFEVAFDLLSVCHVVVIRKHTGGLDLLTEAQVAERFPHLRTDLFALYCGYYVAELLADGTQEDDPHPALFDYALGTLRALADPADRHGLVSAFELVWLRELGYSPRLDTCAACGRDVTFSPARSVYSPSAGGAICPSCLGGVRDRLPLTTAGWAALRALAGGEPRLPAVVRQEVRTVLGLAVGAVLGRRPRLMAYLDAGS